MKKIILLLFAINCFAFGLQAQFVETLDTDAPISCDDMYVDSEGNIYTGKGGLANKTNLGKITPDGQVTSVAEGMKGPISIVESPNGLLYVTNYDDNSIKSYNRETEEVITVAINLDGPSGIAIDSAGVIYATNWGGAPLYLGREIHRLFPDGTLEVFKFSNLFANLQGIAFDDEGWLYVANMGSGRIFKLNAETAELEILATINQGIGNMEYRDGYLYMGGLGSNKIIRMDLNGEWSTFAGTGVAGGVDGPVESATFNSPIGIGFTHSKDTMYVSDAPNRIRRIVFEQVSSTFSAQMNRFEKVSVYPNPSSGIFNIDLREEPRLEAELKVVDVMGNIIHSEKLAHSDLTIDLSKEAAGNYFLVLESGDLVKAIKLNLVK